MSEHQHVWEPDSHDDLAVICHGCDDKGRPLEAPNIVGRTIEGAEVMGVPRTIRLMRGQVVVREIDAPPSAVLWTPQQGPRQVHTHRGVVLGLGPPARLTEHMTSPEVPHGFQVGDVVQYHFGAVGTQAARTRAWVDGQPATWLTQAEVDGVWECSARELGSAMIDRVDGGTTEPRSWTLAEFAAREAPRCGATYSYRSGEEKT